MRGRIPTFVALLAMSGASSGAQSTAGQPSSPPAAPAVAAPAPVPDIPFTKYVLTNGLTLIVHEDHKAPIAAVNVWYHVGSKNEKSGKTGFAHLFEHLMFNGSENFKDDYFKAVEPAGATDLNGTTNEDRTNYFQNVPVSALDRILWLESDRMGHLLGALDQKVLDEQRGVVQNEKRQGENEPYGKQGITVAESTYPRAHPYSWSVIGSMEDLSAASLDDVKEWFRTYYGAANAVVVVAGDVRPEDVKARVERYFGDIPAGPPVARHQTWIARRTGQQRQVLEDRVPQARIVKVWNVPAYGAPDTTYLDMAVDLLAGGKTSRLYRRLVYRDRLATGVTGFIDTREIGGQVWLWADVQPDGDVKAVERAMDEELTRFLASGPTVTELEQTKVRNRASYSRGIERIGGFGGKSDLLAQGQVYGNDPALVTKMVRRTQTATAADVLGAAKRWLSDGAYVLEVRPFPEYGTTTSTVDRSKLPDPGAPPDVAFPTPEKATLSNGLKVQLVTRRAVPIVNLSLVLDAGFAADQSARAGTASLALTMLDEGTTTRTSQHISDALALLGANLETSSSVDASTVSLNVLKDKLDPALALYADVVLNPAFPQKDLDRIKQNTLAQIQQEKVQPVGMALRVLPPLLYGPKHAYGTPLTGSGTEETVKATTREDLAKFHRDWFKPNHATMVVVGDVTLAELTPRLERAFAAWKTGNVPAKAIAEVTPRSATEVFLLDRPGSEQSLILSAQLAPPKRYEREHALIAFNDAFGGSFSGRVNMNLREDKHWSYGAGSFVPDARGQRIWLVFAPVQTDKTKESLQEVIKELREVTSTRPLSAEELQEAKDRQTRTFAGRWETGGGVAGALREILTYGLPEDYYATYSPRIRALTLDDLSKTSKEVLRPDAQIIVIIGDRSKIEAGIRELKLGEVRMLDADGKRQGGTQ
jgi:zinc protease